MKGLGHTRTLVNEQTKRSFPSLSVSERRLLGQLSVSRTLRIQTKYSDEVSQSSSSFSHTAHLNRIHCRRHMRWRRGWGYRAGAAAAVAEPRWSQVALLALRTLRQENMRRNNVNDRWGPFDEAMEWKKDWKLCLLRFVQWVRKIREGTRPGTSLEDCDEARKWKNDNYVIWGS